VTDLDIKYFKHWGEADPVISFFIKETLGQAAEL